MVKATWNGKVVAESNETIEIEGNQYFPPNSIKKEFFKKSNEHSTCPWKGLANYYDIQVDDNTNSGAAWYYPKPNASAIERVGKDFSNYVAFWKGVKVE